MTIIKNVSTITDELLSATTGITVAAVEGIHVLPRSGYVVGGVVPELVVPQGRSVTRDDVDAWVREHLALVAWTPNYRFGAWMDAYDGATHIDVAEIVPELAVALRLAHQRNELAVWDIAAEEEIRTR